MTIPSLRRGLDLGLGGCCALFLSGLVGLTVVDVIGRYVLTAPLAGAFELTQLLLGGLVFAALPLTTMSGEHVEVDVAFVAAPSSLKTIMLWLGALVSAVSLWAIAWRLVAYSARLTQDETVTNALSFPLAPLGWFAAVMAALSGVMALVRLSAHADTAAVQ